MDLKHVEALADHAVADAVALAKQHPVYKQAVEQLADQAVRAIAAAAGIAL